LRTERLTLAPVTVDDADGMLAVYADERMFTFTGGEPPELEALRRRYVRLAIGWNDERTEQWCNWIVRLHERHEPIGVVQATVSVDRSTAWIAWEIAVARWGHGYATEASSAMAAWLRRLGVERIAASIHPDHAASGAVARRLGLMPTDVIDDGEVVWSSSARVSDDR
jgi:RimJ/RimL family protein N-acetyltransferase